MNAAKIKIEHVNIYN